MVRQAAVNTSIKKAPRVPVHGVLLLDKPVGFSSNDALIKAKRMLNAMKAGHTGTLDPFATGLLPLCFGEATKFSQDLLEADKTYTTVVHLGQTTTTGDTEGEILATAEVAVTLEQIHAVLAQFRGPIAQVPPMYSALKRDGKPLYEYARAGITLERAARHVVIHELALLSYQAPLLSLKVKCSKGTYVRVLGEEIGAALGCGGHLQALRRIAVGHLVLEKSITLDSLAELDIAQRLALLDPVDALLSSFPPVQLTDELAVRFLHGQRLALGKEALNLPAELGRVRVYRASDQALLGSAQLQEYSILAPERLIKTEGSAQ
ncbi:MULTISPECIES: tRNA pseudouridine(55) synthase TruB [unclassified Undibacterium]|uniref:tRNA pseudouridine(55) synthase TruB n=1 Tax=unclassified Undibacterium TaxID=2630295 RepID=UPI002AC9B6ED|nr:MULTISPECIES: tRNA pseudouridine(55) synthase TruB [unclassified Undibacterium]MEB0140001.1 tRNA pseudouridine(55) synthase TruB [Undibacterium sp. CCC2.1]MEB0173021.1 tRNA pseudouridine(55) synthase TruB [Undibacterium sp. CCC1.1]MEB0176825.1 tRNA pseudouridine(55) synthase TruB [Undibacterium sp. CCC3.4]MEB0216057.1 tRNA pseudouridine(55) synthase TruB [Undibacterium sp. 5I2]WPX45656.1 tRNA pseudouridine(55) synthase TruB [Undibacterium sp. CCC3.4]